MTRKCLVAILAATLVSPSESTTIISKVPIQMSQISGITQSTGESGYVLINTLTLNRTQPASSGHPVTVLPENADTQIGWAKVQSREFLILLEGIDIETLVRDSLAEGLRRADYLVIGDDHPQAAHAEKVDVEVTSLWVWRVPTSRFAHRNTLRFEMKVVVTSKAGKLSDIGEVSVSGSRSSQNSGRGKSYRNTMIEPLRSFIDIVAERARNSAISDKTTIDTAGASTVHSLVDTLSELAKLHESGAITEEEFLRLKKMAIEEADR